MQPTHAVVALLGFVCVACAPVRSGGRVIMPVVLAAETPSCGEDREALLALDFWTFDQDPERGVRRIANQPGCGLIAADLVRDYHARLRDRGEAVVIDTPQGKVTLSETGETTTLYWHEGQLRAFEGEIQQAIVLFELSLKPEATNFYGWNDYVRASVAFLIKDRPAFDNAHTALAKASPNGFNTHVIGGLAACFDKDYSTAYESDACNRRPQSGSVTID